MSDPKPIPVYIVEKNPKPENHVAGIGLVFFLVGMMIPYWLGDHHAPGEQFVFGVIACFIGVVLGAIINWRIRRKERVKSRGKG